MLRRIIKENQQLFINSKEVVGIQDINFNYNLPIDQIRYLGMESVVFANNGPVLAEMNINKLMIDLDDFIQFTGDTTFSGHLQYKDKYFAFTSGILDNYNISCSINELVTLSAGFSILGDFGSGIQKNDNIYPKNAYKILNYSDIEVSLNDFQFNRLQSFNMTVENPRNIIYKLGNSYPEQIISNSPVEVNLSFSIKADEYQIKNIRDLVCNYNVNSLNIIFKEFKDPFGGSVLTYSFDEILFLGESYAANIDGSVDVTLNYKAFKRPNLTLSQREILPSEDRIDRANTISF